MGKVGLELGYMLVVKMTMAVVANEWIVPLTFMFGGFMALVV